MCPPLYNHSWGRVPLLGGPPGFLWSNFTHPEVGSWNWVTDMAWYGNVFVSKHPKFRANHSFVCQNWGFIRSTSSVCTQFNAYFTHLIQLKAFFVGPLKLNNYIRKPKVWKRFTSSINYHHVLSIVGHILFLDEVSDISSLYPCCWCCCCCRFIPHSVLPNWTCVPTGPTGQDERHIGGWSSIHEGTVWI